MATKSPSTMAPLSKPSHGNKRHCCLNETLKATTTKKSSVSSGGTATTEGVSSLEEDSCSPRSSTRAKLQMVRKVPSPTNKTTSINNSRSIDPSSLPRNVISSPIDPPAPLFRVDEDDFLELTSLGPVESFGFSVDDWNPQSSESFRIYQWEKQVKFDVSFRKGNVSCEKTAPVPIPDKEPASAPPRKTIEKPRRSPTSDSKKPTVRTSGKGVTEVVAELPLLRSDEKHRKPSTAVKEHRPRTASPRRCRISIEEAGAARPAASDSRHKQQGLVMKHEQTNTSPKCEHRAEHSDRITREDKRKPRAPLTTIDEVIEKDRRQRARSVSRPHKEDAKRSPRSANEDKKLHSRSKNRSRNDDKPRGAPSQSKSSPITPRRKLEPSLSRELLQKTISTRLRHVGITSEQLQLLQRLGLKITEHDEITIMDPSAFNAPANRPEARRFPELEVAPP